MKKTKYLIIFFSLIIISLLVSSCAEMTPPSPTQVLKHPFGTTSLKKGMSKEEVVALWGQPNEVNIVKQEKWGGTKEEWVYYARYPAIPVNYNYLSQTKYLYFEGDSLISWKSEKEK